MTQRNAGVLPSGGEQEGGNERFSNLLNALNTGVSSLGGAPRPSGAGNTADATSSRGGIQQVNIQDLQNILQGMGFQQNEAQAAEARQTPASASTGEEPQPMEEEKNSNNVEQGGDQLPESVPEQSATGELSPGASADLNSSPPPSENPNKNHNNDQKSSE